MPIEAGQQLLHYRLIEKIGEGGMGVVWKALDYMGTDLSTVQPGGGRIRAAARSSPDSKRIVYMHDQDYGDIYELVEKK